MDTKTMSYIRRPQEIYRTMKGYVDEVLDYQPIRDTDIRPALIKSKTIQLAIREQMSREQRRQLLRAIIYGKDNGVRVVTTGIKD